MGCMCGVRAVSSITSRIWASAIRGMHLLSTEQSVWGDGMYGMEGGSGDQFWTAEFESLIDVHQSHTNSVIHFIIVQKDLLLLSTGAFYILISLPSRLAMMFALPCPV